MKPGGDAGLLPAILAAYECEPEVLPVEVAFGPAPLACCAKDRLMPRCCTRDDLITVPMADLPPVALLLAWPAHSTSLSAAALARAAAAAIRSNAVASSVIT